MNSVEKALTLLLCFEEQSTWGVRQLSAHLGFSPATVQRLLQSLKAHGFVDQDPASRLYQLGKIYFRFLHTLQSAFPISRIAPSHMQWLLTQTQETVHLNVIDGQERLCIDTVESVQHLKASMPIGSRSPLYAGASSKCLLAYCSPDFIAEYLQQTHLETITSNTITSIEQMEAELKAIRNQGYALSLAERNSGLGSISAPLFDHKRSLIGALSLAIPEIRFTDAHHRDACIARTREAATNLSREMGCPDA